MGHDLGLETRIVTQQEPHNRGGCIKSDQSASAVQRDVTIAGPLKAAAL